MEVLFKTKLQVTAHSMKMFSCEIYETFGTAFTENTRKWWHLQLVGSDKLFNKNIFFKKYLIQFSSIMF